MKKRIIFLSIGFCLLLGIYFRIPLIESIAHWTAPWAARMYDSSLSYRSMHYSQGSFIFKGVTLLDLRTDTNFSYRVEIDEMQLSLSLKRGFLLRNVWIQNLQATFLKKEGPLALQKRSLPSMPLGAIEIEQGKVDLIDLANPTLFKESLSFSIHKQAEQSALHARIDFPDTSAIRIDWVEDLEQKNFDGFFEKVAAERLLHIAQFFQVKALSEVSELQGVIQGHFSLSATQDAFKRSWLDLSLQNLAIRHPLLVVTAEQLQLRSEFEDAANTTKSSLARALWPHFLQNLSVYAEVEKGFFCSVFSPHRLEDIQGTFSLSKGLGPRWDLKGTCAIQQTNHLFSWLGKGYLYSHQKSWLDSELILEHPKAARVRLHTKCKDLDAKSFEVFTHLENMTPATYALFQPLFPLLQKAEFTQGVVQGDMILLCQDDHIQEVHLYGVRAEDFVCLIKEPKTEFSAKSCKGSLEIDFLAQDVRDPLSAYLQCQEASLRWEDKIYLEEISTEIAIEKGHILPSYFSASCLQTKARMTLLGSLHEIKCAMETEGPLYQIAKAFSLESFFPQEPLKAILYYTHRDDFCDLAGELSLQASNASEDHISFTMQLQRSAPCLTASIVDGSIAFKEIDLDKYTAFLTFLPIDQWKGVVSGKALFRQENWFFSVFGKDIEVKTPTFHVSLPQLPLEDPWLISLDPQDFSIESSVALQKARCYLPRFDLAFTNIEAQASLSEKKVFIDIEKTLSEQVSFEGKVSLDLTDIEAVALEIATDHIQGNIQAVDQFLSHFSVCFFEGYPLQASFVSEEKGFYLSTIFSDQYPGVHWDVQAKLFEGTYDVDKHISLKNVQAEIIWQSDEEDFLVQNLQADIALQQRKNTYTLHAPAVHKKAEEWSFDVRITNAMWDCLRLRGSLTPISHAFSINIDEEKTHFFGTHVSLQDVFVDRQARCKCTLQSKTDLQVLPQQLQFLQDLQLVSLVPQQLQKTMQGHLDISLDMDFKGDTSLYLQGKDLVVGDKPIAQFKADIKNTGAIWDIQELVLDDLQAHFTIEKGHEFWRLNGLQASYKDLFQLTMAGTINKELFLDANIDNLSIDLKAAKETWKPNTFFVEQIEGKVQGQGHLIVHLVSLEMDTKLHFEAPHFRVHNLDLVNAGSVALSFSPSEGIQIQGLDFHFQNEHLAIEPFRFQLEKLHFHPGEQSWEMHNVHLLLPKDASEKFGSWMEINFLKNHVQLEKGLDIQMSGLFNPSQKIWEFSSQELHLPLKGKELHLEDVFLQFDATHLFAEMLFMEDKRVSGIQTSIDIKDSIQGRTLFVEKRADIEEKEPLEVIWQWSEAHGIEVRSMQGNYCGLAASLYTHEKSPSSDTLHFSGSLGIDFSRCRHLLDKDFQEMVDSLQMEHGYEFKGSVHITKDTNLAMSWEGIFSGKHCALLGFEFKTLLAHISLGEGNLHLSGLKVSDTAGILKIDELKLDATSLDKVHLSIPKLSIVEFRPSLLKKPGKQPDEIQPLVVRSFELLDFAGDLGDARSFTGRGHLSFINSFKRGYTVFDIPSDLLGRIFGVDQELLIPVQGEIDYEVQRGKFVLLSLKDAYSLNKRSAFFFDPTWPKPTVDFQGNLEIYVKMKHYVLFKFTENFVLSIQGSLQDPRYQLTRKRKELKVHES